MKCRQMIYCETKVQLPAIYLRRNIFMSHRNISGNIRRIYVFQWFKIKFYYITSFLDEETWHGNITSEYHAICIGISITVCYSFVKIQ